VIIKIAEVALRSDKKTAAIESGDHKDMSSISDIVGHPTKILFLDTL
jgi:hypothetical protein